MNTEINIPKLRFREFDGNFKSLHIGDILKIKNGKSQKDVEVDDGKYPILGTGGIIGHTNSFLCDKESVLIGRKGTINNPFYMNTPFWTVDTLFYSEIKKGNDARFIYFLFNTIEWLKYNTSTGVPSLTSSNVEGISVEIPEKNEQRKIGLFFAKMDQLIELQTQKLEQLKKLKQGYLQKMFPKDGEALPSLRFSGFSGEWKRDKLGNNVNFIQGNDGYNTSLPVLTISAKNGWMEQKDRFGSVLAGNELKNYTLLKKGQLSYNHGNSKIAKYGAVFCLNDYDKALVPKVYHSFELKDGSPEFLENLFKSKIPDRQLRRLITSGARMDGLLNIGKKSFGSILLSFPSREEQIKIGVFFFKLDKLINDQNDKINELKKTKKAYLQKMFI